MDLMVWTDNQRPLLAELALLEEYQWGALQSRSRGSSPVCAWLPSTVAAGPGRADVLVYFGVCCVPWARRSADHGLEMADWAHRWQSSPAAVLPAAGEPLDYGQDRCERVDDVLQRVSDLLQPVAVRALAAKSMAEHDKVGACIFERTGGASTVFHGRWDTFVSMAVRVQGAAGHAGRPWPALAAVLGGPDSLMPGPELRAIRSSPRIELSRAAGGPGFPWLFGDGGSGFTFGHCLAGVECDCPEEPHRLPPMVGSRRSVPGHAPCVSRPWRRTRAAGCPGR